MRETILPVLPVRKIIYTSSDCPVRKDPLQRISIVKQSFLTIWCFYVFLMDFLRRTDELADNRSPASILTRQES